MEKINLKEFKDECKKLQGKNMNIKISKIIETTIKIENAQIIINSNRILISNEAYKEINIDINYVSNFLKENKTLKLQLDTLLAISINEE